MKSTYLRHCIVMFLFFTATFAMHAQVGWSPVTPLEGGRTVNIVRKTSSGVLFTGTESNGIFRSSNEGALWTACNNGLLAQGVRDIVLASDGSLFTANSSNVFRSTDDGGSWQKCNTLTRSWALACDGNGRVFAGTDSGVFRSTNFGGEWMRVATFRISSKKLIVTAAGHLFAARDSGIYRSTDNGTGWTKVSSSSNYTIYADMQNGDIYLGNPFSSEVLRSIDNGNTWTTMARPTLDASMDAWPVTMVYRHPVTRVLFVATNVMWISYDVGASWRNISVPYPAHWKSSMIPSGATGALLGGTGGVSYSPDSSNSNWQMRNTGLYAVPVTGMVATPNAVYFSSSTNGVYRSSNNGSSWTSVTNGLMFPSVSSLDYHQPSGTLFAGTSDRFYRSNDEGAHWTPSDSGITQTFGTYRSSYVNTMTMHPNGSMYANDWYHGVYRSTDVGRYWRMAKAVSGVDTMASVLIASNGGASAGCVFMYSTNSMNGTMFHTPNEGATWVRDSSGLPSNAGFSSIIASDKTGTVVTYANGWIYRSNDVGATWTKVAQKNSLQRFTKHRGSGQFFILSNPVGQYATLYRSADDGLTWQDAGSTLTNYAGPRMMTDSGGFLWVGFLNGGEVYRSQQVVPVTFASFSASPELGHALLRWSTVYEARNHGFGIEKKDDAGEWNNIGFVPGIGNSGTLRNYTFSDPAELKAPATYRLRQMDYDGAVQYSSEVTVNAGPASVAVFSLLGTSPSPAHGETELRFSLAEAGHVSIAVHDLLGRKRALLLDEIRAPGTHLMRFDASTLAPGCYLITGSTNGMKVVRTLLVR